MGGEVTTLRLIKSFGWPWLVWLSDRAPACGPKGSGFHSGQGHMLALRA